MVGIRRTGNRTHDTSARKWTKEWERNSKEENSCGVARGGGGVVSGSDGRETKGRVWWWWWCLRNELAWEGLECAGTKVRVNCDAGRLANGEQAGAR